MAHIGIYSTGEHENNLYNVCKIAHEADFDITVFTTESTGETVKNTLANEADKINWEINKKGQYIRNYLSKVESICTDRVDLLHFQAMYESPVKLIQYLTFSPDCKMSMRIQNVNYWLKNTLSWRMKVRDDLHTVFRRLFIRKIDSYVVEYPPMKRYIQAECSTTKPVHTFVPTIYEGSETGTDESVDFVIPGHIESRRRNYHFALDVFETVFEQYSTQLSLTLLGKPSGKYGKEIIERAKEIEAAGHEIEYYEDWVPIDEFETKLQKSDFLFNPVQKSFTSRGVTERYGTSKGSGCYIDALRTGSALILPRYFEVDDIIEESTVVYNSQLELEEQISRMVGDPEHLASFKRAAKENARRYTLEKQKARFKQIVETEVH